VLYVTHSQQEVAQLADTLVIMAKVGFWHLGLYQKH